MIRDTFGAMGTEIEVITRTKSDLEATARLFKDLELRFSRFLSDSELSRINSSPGQVVDVSAPMAEILAEAASLRELTDGRVDPAVGAAVCSWGYDRSFEHVTGLMAEPERVTRHSWEIAGRQLTREPGTQLDLGGVAKGWTADRAVEQGLALLVSAGGDMRSALPEAEVEINESALFAPVSVHLGAAALATSSVTKRRWRAGGSEVHHIIDPTTMAPARSPILGASAVCDTAVMAEAAAKTVLLLGEDGLAWARRQSWIRRAMVTWHDGSVYATKGWELAA